MERPSQKATRMEGASGHIKFHQPTGSGEVNTHSTRSNSCTFGPCYKIGLMVDMGRRTEAPPPEVVQSLKTDTTASEGAPQPEELPLPFLGTLLPCTDEVGSKWLAIMEDRTACTGSDAHDVSSTGLNFYGASGAPNETSWGHSSRVKDYWTAPVQETDAENCLSGVETGRELQVVEYESRAAPISAEPEFTTWMLCDLPCGVMRAVLESELEAMGFGDDYDFLYVPIRRGSGLGYAFINFFTASRAKAFQNAFKNHHFSSFQSRKLCTLKPARLQGFQANVAQFGLSRNERRQVSRASVDE